MLVIVFVAGAAAQETDATLPTRRDHPLFARIQGEKCAYFPSFTTY